MKIKNLRIKDITQGDTLTTGEIVEEIVNNIYTSSKFESEDTCIIIKIGNKNYRLSNWKYIGNKLILIGKR